MKSKLDKLVSDARRDLVVRKAPDYGVIEERLFARIAAAEAEESKARVARLRGDGNRTAWRAVAGGLALAAAAALFVVGKPSVAPRAGSSSELASAAHASALVIAKGAPDQVLLSGVPMSSGADLRAGDVVETRDALAFFERAAMTNGEPPAVMWSMDRASRIAVTKSVGTLVLALEQGSVEAQVTPVASGEAFAVDVAAANGNVTRVAVHGTHLRVARVAEPGGELRLVVDLSEGLVSIGAPPRAGSTYGVLVNAPAHVELDPADPAGTIRVSHLAADLRPALDLRVAMAAPAPAVPALAAHAEPEPAPLAAAPKASTPRSSSPHDPPPDAESVIVSAVRACMGSGAAASPPSQDTHVTVTVSSTLELRVGTAGNVEMATFEPPLPPEVQSCAAGTIYKAHFAKPGTVRIPLAL